MSSFIHTAVAPGLDEDMAASLNPGNGSSAHFTYLSNRASAGTAALRVPAEPCERVWEALERLHRTAMR